MKFFLYISFFILSGYSIACTPSVEVNFDNKTYMVGDDVTFKLNLNNSCNTEFKVDLRLYLKNSLGESISLIDSTPYIITLNSQSDFSDAFIFTLENELMNGGLHFVHAKIFHSETLELYNKSIKVLDVKSRNQSFFTKMILINSGNFSMGAETSDSYKRSNENKVNVSLTKDYMIGEKEVTQWEWFQIMGFNPSTFKEIQHCPDSFIKLDDISLCPNYPVESIKVGDIYEFIVRLNKKFNVKNYRLPTEAE